MDNFYYKSGELFAEQVALADIAAEYGSPCYVYSRAAIEQRWRAFDQAFGAHPHLICYAVKANSNLAVLNVMARLGSGFDIVSAGELERVLAAGGEPGKIIFSGVGKQAKEMARALEAGIRCFNVESSAELELLNEVAGRMEKTAAVSLRVNPDVDAKTHPYISTGLKENKFGIDIKQAVAVYQRAALLPHIRISGIDCHIGSQLTSTEPYRATLERLMHLLEQLAGVGISIAHLDLGGGLGIRYRDETPPEPAEQVALLLQKLRDSNYEILLEPGRAIVGNAGVLLSRVAFLKLNEHKNFAVVDAAMNDLLRPALYAAWQDIVPVKLNETLPARQYDVVGPVCESADFLGKDRQLRIAAGDLLAVRSAGAYGFVMSSNYNTRPRAAEVMVDKDRAYLVRKREAVIELFAGESIVPA